MKCDNFKDLFLQICEIKRNVVKLNSEQLKKYKSKFYNQDFPTWRIDLMWEYIWNDIDYETMYCIFEKNKLI